MTVQGMRRLGVRKLGLYDMSYAAGRYYDQHGSFKRLNGLPVGSVVDASRLPDVLSLAGVSEKTWENNVSSWVRLRMAHRCRPGIVALFVEPLDGTYARARSVAVLLIGLHLSRLSGVFLPSYGRIPPGSRENLSTNRWLHRMLKELL